MNIKITSESPAETRKIASFLIYYIQNYYPHSSSQAIIVSLEGNLGVGKTEFMKGVAEGLHLHKHIFSPTYLLMKSFSLPDHSFFKVLWHLDCYRLKSVKEIELLGGRDILTDPHNIVFIEWGDKIKSLLPDHILRIALSYNKGKKNERLIQMFL